MAETLGLCAGPSVEQLQPVSVSSTPLIRASGVLHTSGDVDLSVLVAAVTRKTPPSCTKDLM